MAGSEALTAATFSARGWACGSSGARTTRSCSFAAPHFRPPVLARWEGRRRYANLRKLARLARSYEELRGPDVEGFVRFVGEQDAAGVRELEAGAEGEGS